MSAEICLNFDTTQSDPTHSFLSKDHFVSDISSLEVIHSIYRPEYYPKWTCRPRSEDCCRACRQFGEKGMGRRVRECPDHYRGHTLLLVSDVKTNWYAKRLKSGRFHPEFHDPNSKVQREMMQCMRLWVDGLGSSQHSILSCLSKESVRIHQNVRNVTGGDVGLVPSFYSFAAAIAHGIWQQILGLARRILLFRSWLRTSRIVRHLDY